jgi:hypothetical protein
MGNGALSCSAENCVQNINGLCAANKIHVTGKGAMTSGNTACDTFAEKSFTNAVTNMFNMNVAGEVKQIFNKGSIEMSPKIECDALRCSYNSNKVCTANNVQIMGAHANSSIDTQCETFVE